MIKGACEYKEYCSCDKMSYKAMDKTMTIAISPVSDLEKQDEKPFLGALDYFFVQKNDENEAFEPERDFQATEEWPFVADSEPVSVRCPDGDDLSHWFETEAPVAEERYAPDFEEEYALFFKSPESLINEGRKEISLMDPFFEADEEKNDGSLRVKECLETLNGGRLSRARRHMGNIEAFKAINQDALCRLMAHITPRPEQADNPLSEVGASYTATYCKSLLTIAVGSVCKEPEVALSLLWGAMKMAGVASQKEDIFLKPKEPSTLTVPCKREGSTCG
jgi:hypothetical protein